MLRIAPVALPPPAAGALVTVIGKPAPVGAVAATFMVAVMVVELTTVTCLNVTPVGPSTVRPVANPDPVKVADVVVPTATLEGAIAVNVGAAITCRQRVHVDEPCSGSATLTE